MNLKKINMDNEEKINIKELINISKILDEKLLTNILKDISK